MTPTEKLESLGLQLPPAPPPAGLYRPILVVDHFLYVSGQGPVKTDGSLYTGRVVMTLSWNKEKRPQDKWP